MKTLVRTLVWIALVIWLGGLFFFPVTAAAAFGTVSDTHVAGTIVARCLTTLHHEGLFAGCWIVLFLLIGMLTRVYRRSIVVAIGATVVMLGFTAYSQFSIIPRMERDRIAAGGAIDTVPKTNPLHADFDRLHGISVHVEEAVMVAGIVLLILLARDMGPQRP